jgi:hypothetical protein
MQSATPRAYGGFSARAHVQSELDDAPIRDLRHVPYGLCTPLRSLGALASIRRWSLRACTVGALAASLALLALCAGAAEAAPPTLIPDGQFESEGALGVAVDQSTSESDPSRGDVYVAGYVTEPEPGKPHWAPGGIGKFDASGRLLSPPSPFGVFPPSPFPPEFGVGGYSGAAVNPVNGDVYALDAFTSEILSYDPLSGESLGSFSVAASGNRPFFGGQIPTTVVGIATDSDGRVYVPVVPEDKVLEYDPATCPAVPEPCVPLKTFTGGSGAGGLKGPTSVAVDASGNVWVADPGNERVEELSPADTPLREINSEGVQSVAVDGHGDVFATVLNSADFCGKLIPPCPHLVEYSSTGAQLADLGAGSIGAQRGSATEPLPSMMAVSESSGRVYVTEGLFTTEGGLHGRVFKFTPPVAPKLQGETAVEVGTSGAKLGAVVNPGGISAAYRFEYGTTTAYGHAVPFPEGDTGGGFQSRTVWAAANGLAPGTTYHYRAVVTGALGEPLAANDQTFTTATPTQSACPNEQFRTGFSANLPDCRAYELVTPPNKAGAAPDPPGEGNNVEGALRSNFAAVDGSRISFATEAVLPGSPSGGKSYVATRRPSGWSSQNMFPPQHYYGFECPQTLEANAYSADLSKAIIPMGGNPECGGPEPELVAGEPKGAENLFVRDNTVGSYQLVNVTPPGVTPANAAFDGASADLDHVVFGERAKLTPDALGGVQNLYEYSGGVVRLAMVLADGTPVAGAFAGISPDGSKIFFAYEGKLYARVNGTSTVQLDASQAGSSGGGGSLQSVTADGSQVFFTDDASASLTADTVPGSGTNLYRYAFATGQLTDLTPAGHAEVQGVLSVSEDGISVYFEAHGSLAAGATQGQPNPYLWHSGTTAFITPLAAVSRKEQWVSRNGAFFAFASTQRLTDYDNTDVNTGEPDPEIYVYAAASDSLVCASCNPSGAPPSRGVRLEAKHFPRNLSDNGRVFFDTSEALLPADTNGRQDVYEYEPAGVGSCSDQAGCVSLISTGTGAIDTWFIEASPSGSDVFLLEQQQLVPQATQEEARTIYDVRVNGGLSEPAAPPACTTADACRSAPAPQPSIFGAPPSQTFSGAGNLVVPLTTSPTAKPKPKPKKCRKGYVKKRKTKKKSKCVKAKKAKARKINRKGSK